MKVQVSVITLFVVALVSSGHAAPAPAPQLPKMVDGILVNVGTGVNRIVANPIGATGPALEMARGIVGSVLGTGPQVRAAEAVEDESE
ncbi:hypothetical protein BKA69DRAFT_1090999 [Paraphysoderma sedebokerense]|nr:hypothetical protein BKA69DRAFT_1090999 [Paraphysoderma sedebokerense]